MAVTNTVTGKMNYLTVGSNTYEIEDKNAAPLASPAFTGTPTAPTAIAGTSTTQIATTEFVMDAMSGAGAGTVTSVGVANATNGGLSISGSPISSSGTITVGHSNVLTSAQTTQAVYPITIDKNGHISAYGSAVTIPTVPTNLTWYGTSSTTASTAAKTVTCSEFALATGAIVGVLFSTANTAATPTLNVNSTGAKSIYVGSATPSATDNVLKWSANTLIYFQYDGTYFRYITSISAGSVVPSRGANTWYGTSSTGATTQAKTSAIDNFVLTKGAVVYITFSTANTYTTNKLTLNINSTGAKDVYYNNAVTSSTNTLLWNAGETLIFIYSGSYYYYAGKSITKTSQLTNDSGYITGITSSMVTTALGYTPYNSTNPNGYTSNTGTVTGVKVNGTTYSPTSGTVDIGTVLTSYTETDPVFSASAASGITSSDITNWNSKTSNIGTITGVKTTAGTHTTIDVSSGNANFNVPTKTSHLTNDSGFITSYTDENMKWTASTSTNTYYPLQSTSTATTGTANTLNSISFYQYYNTSGGYRRLILGNSTNYTSTGGAYGTVRLYGTGATYYGDLNPGTIGANSLTANRTWTLPDKTGTVALTSDIPDTSGFLATHYTDGSFNGTVDWSSDNGGCLTINSSYSASNETGGASFTSTESSLYAGRIGDNYSMVVSSTTGVWFENGDGNNSYIVNVPNDVNGTIALTSDIPTTTSQLTNDSGFITSDSDEKLALTEVVSNIAYYPIMGTDTTAAIRQYDTIGLKYVNTYGTTNTVGTSTLTLGNSTAAGTAGNNLGQIDLYGASQYKITLKPATDLSTWPTTNRVITLPNQNGRIALTDDLPSITLNGNSTTFPSFYAPTSAGTNGYVLKSNGSGAPTWTSAVLTDQNLLVNSTTSGNTYKLVGISTSTIPTTGTGNISGALAVEYTSSNTILRIGESTHPGQIQLGTVSGGTGYFTTIVSAGTTSKTITLPDATGTVALTSNIPSAGTSASAVGTSASGGSASTYSKSDHVHNITSSTITSALGYTPYNSTNPNGYVTTDKNLQTTTYAPTTDSRTNECPLIFNAANTVAATGTKQSYTAIRYICVSGTKTASRISLGTPDTSGTADKYGSVRLYGTSSGYTDITGDNNTGTTSYSVNIGNANGKLPVIKNELLTPSSGWTWRVWDSGLQEAWYHGSITFTTAGASYQGWYRSVQTISLPTGTGFTAFADTATVIGNGAHNAHIFTAAGLVKTNGTEIEVQLLGGSAVAANTTVTQCNIYVCGFAR